MLTPWADFDRTFNVLDELRRRMERTFEEDLVGSHGGGLSSSWPRAALYDTGNELALVAELPGLAKEGLSLSIHEGVLTISGERKARVMEGYAVQRRERGELKFSRSFSLPHRVDADKTTAELKDGFLIVTLPKHPESKPRQINVRAG